MAKFIKLAIKSTIGNFDGQLYKFSTKDGFLENEILFVVGVEENILYIETNNQDLLEDVVSTLIF